MKIKRILISLPLLIIYLIYPLVNISMRFININLYIQWIDILWIILLIFVISIIPFSEKILKLKLRKKNILPFIIFIIFCSLKIFQALIANNYYQFNIIPFLMEVKPIFFLLFALLWFNIFGLPSNNTFQRYGVCLAIIFIADFILENININQGFIRVRGSGEPNYDAMLMGISYIVSTKENDKKNLIILAGIGATLSRTTILAMIIVFLIKNKNSIRKYIIIALGSSVLIYAFILRDLQIVVRTMDRFWMWKTLGEVIFKIQEISLLIGFPIGFNLPVAFPLNLSVLWVSQADAWGLTGIFPYNFHSMWIRLILSYGFFSVISLIVISSYYLYKNRNNRRLLSLVIFIFIEGLAMGVFYLSNISIPSFFALFILLAERKEHLKNKFLLPTRI